MGSTPSGYEASRFYSHQGKSLLLANCCCCFSIYGIFLHVTRIDTFKDYAIETPFRRKSALLEGEEFYEVTIEVNTKSSIAAINFVLKVHAIVLLLMNGSLLYFVL